MRPGDPETITIISACNYFLPNHHYIQRKVFLLVSYKNDGVYFNKKKGVVLDAVLNL